MTKNKYNIIKELFEAVMNIKINPEHHYICPVNIEETIKVWSSGYDYTITTISFNDFFFRCKKWAIEQKYYIWSFEGKDGAGYATPEEISFSGDMNFQLNADSEQQAVFDACQWILENKGN